MNRAKQLTDKKEFMEAIKGMKKCGSWDIWIDKEGKNMVELYKKFDDDKYLWLKKYIRNDRCKTSDGYIAVYTNKTDKRNQLVHRLVAIAWLDNGEELIKEFEVNHKNGDKNVNCADNLEFVTHAQNIRHAWDTGLRKHKLNFIGRYYMKTQELILPGHGRIKLSPEEYVAWRIDRGFKITGWMKDYVYKSKELIGIEV